MSFDELYSEITARSELLSHHKEELANKRGFSDRTIKNLRFFSGGNHLNQVIQELRSRFTDEHLISSGVAENRINKRNGEKELIASSKLTSDNIIIPFLDSTEGKPNGTVYHLYPHKNGFKGLGVKPYCRHLMQHGFCDTVIITESPFKAAVMYQAFEEKYCYCGLSGISSFFEKNFENLNFHNEIKEAIIIFDNEIKSNPDFSNFKEDFWKRYDTEFYTYIMAWKLKKDKGIETRIATLPDSWMEDGKIDCDGALSQGRTRKEFEKVLSEALPCNEYLKQFAGERKWVLDRRIRKYFFRSPIKEDIRGYYIEKEGNKKNKSDYPTKLPPKEYLTNFRMEISKSVTKYNNEQDHYKVQRYLQFTDAMGNKTQDIPIQPEEMESPQHFKNFCRSKGSFTVYKTGLLPHLWEKLEVESKTLQITEFSGVGMIKPELWLFGDCAIIRGKVVELRNGLYQSGYKALLPPTCKENLPFLLRNDPLPVHEIFNKVFTSIGFKGVLMLGFIPLTLFSDIIFQKFGSVPLLGLWGKTGAGKTIAGKWLYRAFGLKDEPRNISTSTSKGITRDLSRLRNLPLWGDEWRNTEADKKKFTQTLLNIYNRSTSTRAKFTNSDETETDKINGTLILSGQATPTDQALFGRFINISFSESDRADIEIFREVEKTSRQFACLTLEILKKEKLFREKLSVKLDVLVKELLDDVSVDSRLCENYASILACLELVFEVLNIYDKLDFTFNDFTLWTVRHIKENDMAKTARDEIFSFFREVETILSNFVKTKTEQENGGLLQYCRGNEKKGTFHFAIRDVWAIYEKDFRQRGRMIPFGYEDIKGYIKKEKFFIDEKRAKFYGKAKTSITLDYITVKNTLLPSLLDGEGEVEE